ncbi:SNF2-related protein [Runella sp.]|uniref:DEAD/DEAH box helicase n=1 Tax=Runella sp. TaxID=1960881 RepID=UPI003D0A87C6
MREHPYEYILENTNLSAFSYSDLLKHSSDFIDAGARTFFDIQPQSIDINVGVFIHPSTALAFPGVSVSQLDHSVILSCPCKAPKKKLCEHQAQVLYNIIDRPYLRIFFDSIFRHIKMQEAAKDYGLEEETDLDDFFYVEYTNKSFEIKPKLKNLFPLNKVTNDYFREHLLPKKEIYLPATANESPTGKMAIVFRKHKYYDRFGVELVEGQVSRDGKLKNPLTVVDPLNLIWKTEQLEEAKFYTAVSKFQQHFSTGKTESALEALKIIVRNPLHLDAYYHDANLSENITASSILSVKLHRTPIDIKLSVDQRKQFYEITGELILNDKTYPLKTLNIKYDYFIHIGNTLHLITNPDMLRVIHFFRKSNPILLIHASKYDEFRQTILAELEHQITIRYAYLRPATKKQPVEYTIEADRAIEKIIYLSDQNNYVVLTPVVKYGTIEVPVSSKKRLYDTDQNGNIFEVERDEELEVRFTSLVVQQHPDFEEQLQEMNYFYLHKDRFLNEDWFLVAFEIWKNDNITILGFNELTNNRLNANKARVSISVSSGTDWFDTSVEIKYGKQKATLKQLHKSIRNKSKFVQLDDGTMGILPAEWMQKITAFFQAGEVNEEVLKIPKSNFTDIDQLFEDELLSQEVKDEVAFYHSKFASIGNLREVPVPKELNGALRDYQRQGLNWLNFLDEHNFGACLADDMGLGKTIQIIAFILLQRAKYPNTTNLIVVPTSLLFNWQDEMAKFAPSVKLFTHYGPNRLKTANEFDGFEVILTTYGMILSDIYFLKTYRFNYIFLDESQAIKNPESQRYKAVKLLQSRNKVVLTGTPIENNTFDIYGQLSFACPGLLGNKQFFKAIYSTPIDKFEDSKRSVELQKKIQPFILRRTKKQVASELPDKIEMIIYCEMGEEQRKIYTIYEKELRDFILGKSEDDIKRSGMHVLTGLTKLRQICNSPALLKEEAYQGDFSSKVEVLMEQIENKSSQHKILVFSQFVIMLDVIKKELEVRNIPFEYLTGKTKNRASKVNEFQNNDNVRVFLISLKAGGTGLNLTEADYVYLIDPWWNPAVENQAIDRSYRIGQTKNVIAVRLICPNTIEEKVVKLQETKTKLVGNLLKSDESIMKSLSKNDLLDLLE